MHNLASAECRFITCIHSVRKIYVVLCIPTAILRLPSNLFYDCSLLTRSEQSDPHPKAPYPLVFVCSSLNKHDTCLSGSSESEAKIVVKYTEELLQEWPHGWGRFRPQDICIMTQNNQQVRMKVL